MKTINNPGSFSPYLFKSNRQIASSVFQRLKKGKFIEALNFSITEALNKINKKKILDITGKYYCPLCENRSGAFIHMSNSYRYSFNSVCPYCSFEQDIGLFLFCIKKKFYPLIKIAKFYILRQNLCFTEFFKTNHSPT